MNPAPNNEVVAGTGAPVRIERILCPVDFSEISAKAYRYAQSIAQRYRAKLILQHVVELAQHPSGYYCVRPSQFDQFRQVLLSNAEHDLKQFVERSGGGRFESIMDEGIAADSILSLAQARGASLIVMGTHGRRGFDHLMLGSATERVLRHAACPVLAVTPKTPDTTGSSPAEDSIRVQHVLCCVDFSAPSVRALEHALSVAEVYGAELTLFHILDNIAESDNVATETDAAEERLRKLIAPSALPPAKVHLRVGLGKAYREILDFATQNHPDLIVTGVRGRNSLDLAVFGSTTYRVIQLYAGPVLTVSA